MSTPLLRRRDIHGYEALQTAMKEADFQKEQTIIYFCGNRNGVDGSSWCPDCVESDQHVNAVLKEIYEGKVQIPSGREFITCFVGDREEWKRKDNDFRKHMNIQSIPTFLVLGSQPRNIDGDNVTYDMIKEIILS